MRPWLVPVYAVLGFIAIVWVAPTSRWVVLTQLDVVAGRWRYHHNPYDDSIQDSFDPVQPGLDNEDQAPDETAKFLRLVAPSGNMWHVPDLTERAVELYDICKAKNDVRSWATFVRVASAYAVIQKPAVGKVAASTVHNDPAVQTRLREACFQGEKLDPENAYFPMIMVGLLDRLGDKEGSRKALDLAASLPGYDDYGNFEPEARLQYLVDHFGSRGNQFRAHLYFETLLQHVSVIASLRYGYAKPDDIPGRVALLKMSSVIMDHAKNGIVVFVAQSLATYALSPGRSSMAGPISSKEIDKCAASLVAAGGSSTDVRIGVATLKSISVDGFRMPPVLDEVAAVQNLRPAYSAWSLWSIVLLPLALGLAAIKVKKPSLAPALPFLIWLLALPADAAFDTRNSPTIYMGLATFLFIPALFSKNQTFLNRAKIAIILVTIPLSVYCPSLVAPAVLFAVSVFIERKLQDVPLWLTIVGFIAACAVGSAYWISVAVHLHGPDGVLFGLLATIGACAFIPIKGSVNWQKVCGVACLVLGLVYAGMVTRDISADRQLAVVCDNLINSGDRVRQSNERK